MKFKLNSLDDLVRSERGNVNDVADLRRIFNHASRYFQEEKKLMLMLQKGVFPSEYMDNVKKLKEACLPSLEKFGSSLSQGVVYKEGEELGVITKQKEERYQQAMDVFEEFQLHDIKE